MKNLKTLGLFALTMLGSCQKQEKTNATDIDTTTFAHAQIPEEKAPATLPEGYVWCVQSQKMFEQQFGLVATVYKDSNDICTPCTMIVHDLARIPVEYEYENMVPVQAGTNKVPADVRTYSLLDFANQIKENCDFERATGNPLLIMQRKNPRPQF